MSHPISLDCPIKSYSGIEVKVEWLRSGIPLKPDDTNIQLMNDGQRITLLNPTNDHFGVYSCVAKNLAGEIKKDFQLNILCLFF